MSGEPTTPQKGPSIPHAFSRAADWAKAWKDSGAIRLLLDFDGTLAPIVSRPEEAAIDPRARAAVERLARAGATVAIVSGRGLADARDRIGVAGLAFAGNHGMEIEMPNLRRVHPEATAARPNLQRVADVLAAALDEVPGAEVEDKGLTLSIHYRRVDRAQVPDVRDRVLAEADRYDDLRVTEGKEVLEVRPAIDWHKGRAVEFLLEQYGAVSGAPVLYLGDDRTDEDAFEVLRDVRGGEGVVVGDPIPSDSAATAYLKSTKEVAELLDLLADNAPG